MTSTWLRDTIERVVFTYLEALTGLLIANGTGLVDVNGAKAAAVAAIPAALAVLKAALASKVSGTVSAASIAKDPNLVAARDVFQEL